VSVEIRAVPGSWDEVILDGVMVGFVYDNLFIASGHTGLGLTATALRILADHLEAR
jgi:glycine/D-amino acid oxidase-like deaminating enzyme